MDPLPCEAYIKCKNTCFICTHTQILGQFNKYLKFHRNNTFGLNNHMDGPMHNNRGMMLPGNGMNAGGMNAMNANANSNMSSMTNPLGQLVQMNPTPNSHLNSMNSPNGSRLGSSSPSLAVNSPNMGLNGNRVPGKQFK